MSTNTVELFTGDHAYAKNFTGWLSRYHLWRFHWLTNAIKRTGPTRVNAIELGCFDARSVEFIPVAVESYDGFESDVRSVSLARQRWNNHHQIRIHHCELPEQMNAAEPCNLAICMEVLEHLPDDLLHGYLERIAALLNGYLLVTVPVEFGPVFLAKNLAQRILRRPNDNYRWRDTFWATMFRPDKLPRQHHKGFDYRQLVRLLERHFEVESVEGMSSILPPWLGLTVGIVARSRH